MSFFHVFLPICTIFGHIKVTWHIVNLRKTGCREYVIVTLVNSNNVNSVGKYVHNLFNI